MSNRFSDKYLIFDFYFMILISSTLTLVDVARAFFSRLRPQNCMTLVWDPDHKKSSNTSRISAVDEEWKVEKWYKGGYRQMKIPDDIAEQWSDPKSFDPRLFLPKMNEFIPTDFSLRCEDKDFKTKTPENPESVEPPVKLIDSENLRLWHKTDTKFKVPRTSFHMVRTLFLWFFLSGN